MVDVSNLKIEMEDPANAAATTVVEPHNKADDSWAMTPSVTLKNGKYYRYSVNAASNLHMVDGKARLAR